MMRVSAVITDGERLLQPPRYLSHHCRAFWNILSQGETGEFFISSGIHAHCQGRMVLSGWGIMARCLPSGLHRAVIPWGDPLGLKG